MFGLLDTCLLSLERLWQHRVLALWVLLGLCAATTLALSQVSEDGERLFVPGDYALFVGGGQPLASDETSDVGIVITLYLPTITQTKM